MNEASVGELRTTLTDQEILEVCKSLCSLYFDWLRNIATPRHRLSDTNTCTWIETIIVRLGKLSLNYL